MLGLAGFQDGVEIESPVGHVLTHAEEDAVQVIAQLDWLRATTELCDICNPALKYNKFEALPDSEVIENQLPSRESYPVNRPASKQQRKLVKILKKKYLHLEKKKKCCDTSKN